MSAFRIVSLWDMLKEIEAGEILGSAALLTSWSQAAKGDREHGEPITIIGMSWDQLIGAATKIAAEAERLAMPVSLAHSKNIISHLGARPTQIQALNEITTLLLTASIDNMISALRHELGARLFFSMPSEARVYYEPNAPLFGDDVANKFPSSNPEIEEAGKCRALGRWTACVMHLMRALEPALLALQTAVGVNVPKEQWNQIIDQIESKIKEIKKATHGKADEQWFSEAATHFRLIKDAWRNHSQHLHERYDEERAVAIYDSVRAFMRHLATRLSE